MPAQANDFRPRNAPIKVISLENLPNFYSSLYRLTSVGGQNYTFDDNGNKTSDGVHTLTYDPATGRFLTRDPWPGNIYRPQSLNGWSYVEGNPINRVDPSGYCWGPAASLRNVPGYGTLCNNLDMAIFIAGNPNATAVQRAEAVTYFETVVLAHAALAVGVTALAMEEIVWLWDKLNSQNQTNSDPNPCSPEAVSTGIPGITEQVPMRGTSLKLIIQCRFFPPKNAQQ